MNDYVVIDWCSGTGSFSEAFEKGDPFRWGIEWEVFEFDIEEKFDPDFCVDVMDLSAADVEEMCGISDDTTVVFLASPPCKAFSLAAVAHHWEDRGDEEPYVPESDFAKLSMRLVSHTFDIIERIDPYAYFVENPRAMGRKVWGEEPTDQFTWCQYRITNDMPMKPSDGWTDLPSDFQFLFCANGADCHESAPRGSSTGTQGLKNEVKRAAVPYALSSHLRDVIERSLRDETPALDALVEKAASMQQ